MAENSSRRLGRLWNTDFYLSKIWFTGTYLKLPTLEQRPVLLTLTQVFEGCLLLMVSFLSVYVFVHSFGLPNEIVRIYGYSASQPAAKDAEVPVGAVIDTINGQEIHSVDQVVAQIQAHKHQVIDLVVRLDESKSVEAGQTFSSSSKSIRVTVPETGKIGIQLASGYDTKNCHRKNHAETLAFTYQTFCRAVGYVSGGYLCVIPHPIKTLSEATNTFVDFANKIGGGDGWALAQCVSILCAYLGVYNTVYPVLLGCIRYVRSHHNKESAIVLNSHNTTQQASWVDPQPHQQSDEAEVNLLFFPDSSPDTPDCETPIGWPSPQDYNEAIQNGRANFTDVELQNGNLVTDAFGLPRPITGAFASVYRIKCESGDFAIKCFFRNSDHEHRYRLTSSFLRLKRPSCTMRLEFIRRGIRVNGFWYPILKMEWVEGRSLDEYIAANLGNPAALRSLEQALERFTNEFRAAGIAHGDLQHGNVLVSDSGLRLVDYDGMYVPPMRGLTSTELGHRNYQHPMRKAEHFGPHLDNFSAIIIWSSVRILRIAPDLCDLFTAGEDCLLFKESDFLDSENSPIFSALKGHDNLEVNRIGHAIRRALIGDPVSVPYLNDFISQFSAPQKQWLDVDELPSIVRTKSSLPDWLLK